MSTHAIFHRGADVRGGGGGGGECPAPDSGVHPSTFTNISSEMTVPIKLEFHIFLYSDFLRMPK